jgi:hypothetical protein
LEGKVRLFDSSTDNMIQSPVFKQQNNNQTPYYFRKSTTSGERGNAMMIASPNTKVVGEEGKSYREVLQGVVVDKDAETKGVQFDDALSQPNTPPAKEKEGSKGSSD